jgi:DNA-binding GntR family transcriptional regulator
MKTLADLKPVEIRSADDVVYETLRNEIVHGLAPATVLRLRDLADRFSVSTMPVRAALGRLQAEGLVIHAPRRGAVVAPLSLSDLRDIQAVRAGLEGMAAREGVANLTARDLERMRRLFEELRALTPAGRQDRYLRLIRDLHEVVYDAAGHPKLSGLIDTYRRSAERYLRLALREQSDVLADVERQERFLVACEDRDAEAAEEGVRALLGWTVERLAPLIEQAG